MTVLSVRVLTLTDLYENGFLPPGWLVVPAVLDSALHHGSLPPGPLCPLDISPDEVRFLPRFSRGWSDARLARPLGGVPGHRGGGGPGLHRRRPGVE